MCSFFFFQAEDGIRDPLVTGVQTCALPICLRLGSPVPAEVGQHAEDDGGEGDSEHEPECVHAARPRAAQALAESVKGASGIRSLQRSRSSASCAESSAFTYEPAGPTPRVK